MERMREKRGGFSWGLALGMSGEGGQGMGVVVCIFLWLESTCIFGNKKIVTKLPPTLNFGNIDARISHCLAAGNVFSELFQNPG